MSAEALAIYRDVLDCYSEGMAAARQAENTEAMIPDLIELSRELVRVAREIEARTAIRFDWSDPMLPTLPTEKARKPIRSFKDFENRTQENPT